MRPGKASNMSSTLGDIVCRFDKVAAKAGCCRRLFFLVTGSFNPPHQNSSLLSELLSDVATLDSFWPRMSLASFWWNDSLARLKIGSNFANPHQPTNETPSQEALESKNSGRPFPTILFLTLIQPKLNSICKGPRCWPTFLGRSRIERNAGLYPAIPAPKIRGRPSNALRLLRP